MSTTIHAYVVLGCKIGDVVKEETRRRRETWFHEKTGTPYEKIIDEKVVILGRGPKQIEFPSWGDMCEFFGAGKAVKGLAYFSSGGCDYGRTELQKHSRDVIGVQLADVDDYDDTPALIPALLPNDTHAVHGWLKDIGMDDKYWQSYLVLYVG